MQRLPISKPPYKRRLILFIKPATLIESNRALVLVAGGEGGFVAVCGFGDVYGFGHQGGGEAFATVVLML